MTGNHKAHLLLISLANIFMDFRMKLSNHVFLLLALLPIPKFIHPNHDLHGVLENWLIHECLDFVLQPLKKAAEIGVMMMDPLGCHHYCFTPWWHISWILPSQWHCQVLEERHPP